MTPLHVQAAAVERAACNWRAFVERRSSDSRWPREDIDRGQRLADALDHAALTMRRLCECVNDPKYQAAIVGMLGDASGNHD